MPQDPLAMSGSNLGDVGQLLDSLGKNFVSGKQKVTKSSRPQDNNAVQSIIDELLKRANNDTMYKDLVENLFKTSAEQFAPTKAAEVSSGAYNSTTTALMQNDARARAVAAANQAILDAKRAALETATQAQVAVLNANSTTEATTKAPFENLLKPFGMAEDVGKKFLPGVVNTMAAGVPTPGTVICTELNRQGRFPTSLLIRSYRWAKIHHSTATWRGYQAWGQPIAKKMQTSPLLTMVFEKIALSRAEYLHGKGSVFGLIVHITATPLCYLLGKVLEWKERPPHQETNA